MFRFVLVIKVISALVIFKTNAARILCVFPTPSHSHQIAHRGLIQALAKRGHDLVVITTHPFPPGETPLNVTEINVYEVSNHLWQNGLENIYGVEDLVFTTNWYLKTLREIFENEIQFKPVQDLIKKEGSRTSFDLIILDCSMYPALGLLNIFDAPAIQTSTFGPIPGIYDLFGAPNHPLLYPATVYHRTYNLTLWEKVINLYKFAINIYLIRSNMGEDDKMLQRHLVYDMDPTSILYERVQAYLQTVYSIWVNNPPLPQGIVYLGGLHQKSANDLPQDLQTFVNSFENGVIYVSFGTNVHPSLLSQEKIQMMDRVFSKLQYGVLWKRDQDTGAKTAKNIKISKWFPQSDLLHHPKVKLFITQAGLQSSEEAIAAGVPLIGIPMLGDQWANAENYVHHRIGLNLDWSAMTEDQLSLSIASVTEDKTYVITTIIDHRDFNFANFKDNVLRLRSVMNDQPQSPEQRATWWAEYVIRHGGTRHLRPAAANMSWLHYYEVELVMIVVSAALFGLGILCFIFSSLARCICSRRMCRRHYKII